MTNHVISILIATCFFVTGQIFLRKSLDHQNYLQTWCIFSIAMGIIGCIGLWLTNETSLAMVGKNKNAWIAGIVFAVGNLLWIYSISTKVSIGIIRTIMAGFETLLLFLVGYMLFSETFYYTKLAGIFMILVGIYFIG